METAIECLRFILAGTFDRLPDLQLILGHWGEMLVFYLDRVNEMSRLAGGLERPIADYVRQNFSVTPSGIFVEKYLRNAIEVMGVDRVLFSTDYPYEFALEGGARKFLMESTLSQEEKAKVAHGNWERLTGRR